MLRKNKIEEKDMFKLSFKKFTLLAQAFMLAIFISMGTAATASDFDETLKAAAQGDEDAQEALKELQ